MTRFFKVVHVLLEDGTDFEYDPTNYYSAETCKQAVSKAFTRLVQSGIRGKTTISIQECVEPLFQENDTYPVFIYEAERVKLDNPQVIEITDRVTSEIKEIKYHYRNKIVRINGENSSEIEE